MKTVVVALLHLMCFVVLTPHAAYSQESRSQQDSASVYSIVEEMPVFPGGSNSLYHYMGTNFQVPTRCDVDYTRSRIFTSFVVDTSGKVVQIELLRGITPCVDSVAVHLLENMPNWTPGKQNGVPVKVKMTLPFTIHFK